MPTGFCPVALLANGALSSPASRKGNPMIRSLRSCQYAGATLLLVAASWPQAAEALQIFHPSRNFNVNGLSGSSSFTVPANATFVIESVSGRIAPQQGNKSLIANCSPRRPMVHLTRKQSNCIWSLNCWLVTCSMVRQSFLKMSTRSTRQPALMFPELSFSRSSLILSNFRRPLECLRTVT